MIGKTPTGLHLRDRRGRGEHQTPRRRPRLEPGEESPRLRWGPMRAFQFRGRLTAIAAVSLALLASSCGGSAAPPTRGEPPQSSIDATSGTVAARAPLNGGSGAAQKQLDAPIAAAVPTAAPTSAQSRAGSGNARDDAPAVPSNRVGAAGSIPDTNSSPPAASDAGVASADGVVTAATGIAIPGNETVIPLPTATPAPTATAVPSGFPTIGGCPVFPADNAWNQDISTACPSMRIQRRTSRTSAAAICTPTSADPAPYGIPYIIVPQSQPMVPINFTDYGDESDPGPYPIPLTAPIEGGAGSTGDRHVLAVQQGTCKLYEMFSAYPRHGRLECGIGRRVRPALERAAAGDVDLRRCRGAADHRRPRALRRSRGRARSTMPSDSRSTPCGRRGCIQPRTTAPAPARRASPTAQSCG